MRFASRPSTPRVLAAAASLTSHPPTTDPAPATAVAQRTRSAVRSSSFSLSSSLLLLLCASLLFSPASALAPPRPTVNHFPFGFSPSTATLHLPAASFVRPHLFGWCHRGSVATNGLTASELPQPTYLISPNQLPASLTPSLLLPAALIHTSIGFMGVLALFILILTHHQHVTAEHVHVRFPALVSRSSILTSLVLVVVCLLSSLLMGLIATSIHSGGLTNLPAFFLWFLPCSVSSPSNTNQIQPCHLVSARSRSAAARGDPGGSMPGHLEHNSPLHSRALHSDSHESTHFCILSHPSRLFSTQPPNPRAHIHLQPIHPNLLNHLSDFILLSAFSFSSFMAFFAPDFNHSVTVHDLSSSHSRSYSIIPVFCIFVELVLIIFW